MSSTNAPKRLSFCSPSLSCSSEIAPPPPKGIFFIMACMLPATIGIGGCNYVCQEVRTISRSMLCIVGRMLPAAGCYSEGELASTKM